ncbi:WAP four-disulfide core domain protein 8 [Loxodonta africana]|uniref:WAP four-disulfide core domain protein 8 n=1 Tax=Loxodonta africana TaxID=9785 RepID=UPI000C812EA3|nr:WAP four-disulfide core domain protein 8 [Loxodonta africana]
MGLEGDVGITVGVEGMEPPTQEVCLENGRRGLRPELWGASPVNAEEVLGETLKGYEFGYSFFVEKPGKCPKERLHCTSLNSSCETDLDCQDYLKCCSFNCMKTCLDPYKEPCLLPLKPGDCHDQETRYFYSPKNHQCMSFVYRGCHGNVNNFLSKNNCKKACARVFKKGQCPLFPFNNRMECPSGCRSDYDCPRTDKCCDSACGFVCAKAWKGEDWGNTSQSLLGIGQGC